jgi:hypothetical protein
MPAPVLERAESLATSLRRSLTRRLLQSANFFTCQQSFHISVYAMKQHAIYIESRRGE